VTALSGTHLTMELIAEQIAELITERFCDPRPRKTPRGLRATRLNAQRLADLRRSASFAEPTAT